MAAAKYKVGDRVNHPAAPDGSFPAGVGVVESVKDATAGAPAAGAPAAGTPAAGATNKPASGPTPTAGAGATYKVRCEATKQVLPVDFKEADLSAA